MCTDIQTKHHAANALAAARAFAKMSRTQDFVSILTSTKICPVWASGGPFRGTNR